MNLIKRIKKSWKLAKKDNDALFNLTDKQLMDLPDEDTKAIFFGTGDEKEFKDYENEQKGMKGIFGL